MAAGPEAILRYLRRLVIAPQPDAATDAALLGRFISERDEKAFAVLVDRHGPLVLNVCRRLLGDVNDAEDAFQAAFLVLARKASTIHPREALAGWLYGVARRVALKARSARVRQLRKARRLVAPPADSRPDPLAEVSARELLAIVDEEVQRLAEAYRLPVILCCLEGRSVDEAARQLGWTPGSVRGRLDRGRARLQDRLRRRGLKLSAALTVAGVLRDTASAAVVARLVAPTLLGAMAFATDPTTASGVSIQAAALASDVLRAMALDKLKLAMMLLIAGCITATGFLIYTVAHTPSTTAHSAAFVNNRPTDLLDDADAPIEVNGRVLDPAGKPLPGANIYLGYSRRHYAPAKPFRQMADQFRTTSGADGRFHFTFVLSELDETLLDDSWPAVVAVAAGYGADWAAIRESAQGAEVSLRLVHDLPVNGRILNQDQQPVPGAKVWVREIESGSADELTRLLQAEDNRWPGKAWRGSLPEQPAQVTTANDGRFQLTGIGRDRTVSLAVDGAGIEHIDVFAVTRPTLAQPYRAQFHLATFDQVAPPSRPIRGVVRNKATGRPVAGVKMSANRANSPTLTDEQGRFEILGCPRSQEYLVIAQPHGGQPYFTASARPRGGPGLGPVTADLELVSGIPLRGQLTVQTGRKLPKTAVVEYYPLFFNALSSQIGHSFGMPASSTFVQPDGSFRLVVWPGPGVICLAASPRDSFAVASVDDEELVNLFSEEINRGKGQRLPSAEEVRARGIPPVDSYNALALIDPDEQEQFVELDLSLQPARRLLGTVVGPDGEPLSSVKVIGLTARPNHEMLDGTAFTVTGLNPQRSRDLFFHHKERNLGKTLSVRGDEAGPLTVQLEPCGWVIGRIVDSRGQPVPAVTFYFNPQDYDDMATTNRDGRFRVALVPGRKYSLAISGALHLSRIVDQIEVESGRNKDLGDLHLAEPLRGGRAVPAGRAPRGRDQPR